MSLETAESLVNLHQMIGFVWRRALERSSSEAH
jgi:hypothetical protein